MIFNKAEPSWINMNAGDVYWAASDVGWVVGHSYIVYGPPSVEYVMDDFSQLPINDDHLCRDPEYSRDAYIQA